MKRTNRKTSFAIAKLAPLFAIAAACFAGCGADDGGNSGPEGASESQCTGTPNSCSFLSAPGCSSISGCAMRSTLRGNGTWDNYCDGVPDPCRWSKSVESCKDQDGCKWSSGGSGATGESGGSGATGGSGGSSATGGSSGSGASGGSGGSAATGGTGGSETTGGSGGSGAAFLGQ
jgi:hypothetical protein